MPRTRQFLIIALWLGMLHVPASGQSREQFDLQSLSHERSASTTDPNVVQAEQAIVERTNQFRQEHRLPAVTTNPELVATAQYFADYMARTGQYGHQADGQRPAERARQHGYDFCIITENIAYQFSTAGFTTEQLAQRLMTGWIESPAHRANLLDADVTQTGIAIAEGDENRFYAVQMFGRPASARHRFQISNQSEANISYTLTGQGEEEPFELPPRYTRTHQRCRPTTVHFRWNQPNQLKPTSGSHYIVRGNAAEGFEVTEAAQE